MPCGTCSLLHDLSLLRRRNPGNPSGRALQSSPVNCLLGSVVFPTPERPAAESWLETLVSAAVGVVYP